MDAPISQTPKTSFMHRSWHSLVDQFRQACGYKFPRMGPLAFATIIKTLPSVIDTQLFPGIKATLDLRDETQRTTYWFGTRFEEPTPEILLGWSANATHFFDIGSNYGFYSYLLHSSAPHLEIYPFEPNPKPFDHLTKICSKNRTSRIHPQPYGLSDENGRLKFLQLSGNSGHSSFATVRNYMETDSQTADGHLTECDVIPFDLAVEYLHLPFPDEPAWIAKLDVEGYELKVLNGMRAALLRKSFKGICIELVEENLALADASERQVVSFLYAHGYRQMANSPANPRGPTLNHNAFYVPLDCIT